MQTVSLYLTYHCIHTPTVRRGLFQLLKRKHPTGRAYLELDLQQWLQTDKCDLHTCHLTLELNLVTKVAAEPVVQVTPLV